MSSTVGPARGHQPADAADPVPAPEATPADVPAPAPAAAPPAAPGAGVARRGGSRSAPDMLASILVIAAIVAVIVALVPRPNAQAIRAVDVAGTARQAAARVGFTPAVPVLPDGWVATSADVRDSADGIVTWHVGYLTPDGHYAGIEQAARVTDQWEVIMDSGGVERPPVLVDGTTWEQRYKDVREVTALIHRGEGRTTMVTSKGGGLANAEVLARSIAAPQR